MNTKLVKETLFEFTRNSDPLDTLGIGNKAKIHKFFDDLGIPRGEYTIEGKQIIFPTNLTLYNYSNLIQLPDNLQIENALYLKGCINLVKLPNNLKVGGHLYLYGCNKLVELPNDLKVNENIFVYTDQEEFIKWAEKSKFSDKIISYTNES